MREKNLVLLANHERDDRDAFKQMLGSSVDYLEVSSGFEAVRALASDSPDCVFIDHHPPECNALEFLTRIDPELCPVVIMSAREDDAVKDAAVRRGALDVLSKPELTTSSLSRSLRLCVRTKQLAARLRAAESKYQDIFNQAPVMYVITNGVSDSATVDECNRLFADTLGYADEAIAGRPLFEFLEQPARDEYEECPDVNIVEMYSTPNECALRTGAGASVPVIVHAARERDGDGISPRARIMLIDITRSREAEEALRKSDAEMRALVDANPDTLIKLEEDGSELLFEPVQTEVQLDDESPIRSAHLDLSESHVQSFRRHAELALEGGPPMRFDYELSIDDVRRSFEARLVRRSRNELLAIIRERTRERELEQQLLQSQRLEAVGKLAGGVAHDFNNFLTVISGNAELALLDVDDDDPNVPIYREIVETSARAADLTRQLLAFSRQQLLKLRIVDLSHLVSTTQRMLRRLIGEDIEIETSLASDLPAIRADPGQVEQILMNLAVNARDAMPTGGKLTFETSYKNLLRTEVGHDFNIPSGCYAQLTVTDTGVGMNENTRNHLFEPFYTTKERGQGTGLGLSTAYGIVKQSDGYIRVESEPETGTRFDIYFPAATGVELDSQDVPESPPEHGSGETVVLVEDDASVLSLARSILERGGYRVAAFQRGHDAVRFIKDDPSRIDLLATDVVMPEMSGRTVADTVLHVCEDLPVLYLSGYTDDARMRHGVLDAEMNLLEKPFSRAELLIAVRTALGSASRPE